jgi:polyisoprenoid-binding protein YceI
MLDSKAATINLSGTTPIKNWTMQAHGLSGEAEMTFSSERRLIGIDSLSFRFPVRNLKGDEPAMDKSAYKALKSDRYKEITFVLLSATVESTKGGQQQIAARGNLRVAGVTRLVTLSMRSTVQSDDSISFTGSQSVKMSDYHVERPSVLFGTVRAGDEMVLHYSLIFTK